MQIDSIEVEGSRATLRKFKAKEEKGERKNEREEVGDSCDVNEESDQKMDEIIGVIKILSKKDLN